MIICQSIGYNGFKRWHRRRVKKFKCWSVGLENELFDNYRKQPNISTMPSMYSPTGLKEHLLSWDSCLENALGQLCKLSFKFLEATGVINCFIKKAICRLQKDREKVRRWYHRFEECNWSAHDIHVLDMFLHEHERKKEKKGAKKDKNPY